MKKLMVVAALAAIPGSAEATQRHFSYTYESAVLTEGEREVEPWTTWRNGHAGFYSRFDHRLEFEAGLTDRLQTSIYLNLISLTEDTGAGRRTAVQFDGVSSEWKYKLSDPVADAFGSALYLEGRGAAAEAELEARLILDKRVGKLAAAFNLMGAHEWAWTAPGQVEGGTELEADLGIGYFLLPELSVGLEARSHNQVAEAGWESSVLFAGPSLGYAGKNWWVSLSVMPQLAAFRGATAGRLNLSDHEKLETRFLLGVEL